MDLQAAFHWIYVIAMAIGALYFIFLSKNPRGVPKSEYLVATFIPIWSGLAYLAMALDQGKVEVAGLRRLNRVKSNVTATHSPVY